MPKLMMTEVALRRLRAPPGERVDYFDLGCAGLSLRVTGAKAGRPQRATWTYFYRFGGDQRRPSFGLYPAVTLAEVRARVN